MEIKVYQSLDAYSKRKSIYVRRIEVTEGVTIDIALLLRAMRILYPGSVVEFLIVP